MRYKSRTIVQKYYSGRLQRTTTDYDRKILVIKSTWRFFHFDISQRDEDFLGVEYRKTIISVRSTTRSAESLRTVLNKEVYREESSEAE